MPTLSKSVRLLALPLALLVCAAPAFAAGPVTGVVTNRTTGQPAAGDDVLLLELSQGMQETARTKTDAKGKFTLTVPGTGAYLVQVTQDKTSYYKTIQPGTQSIEMDVYSAAAKVAGVSEEADVMRIETDAAGTGLHVTEAFFLKNDSSPKMTQFGDRPFDFFLPPGAVVEGSAALSPGGMPVSASPMPVAGSPNRYTFVFPIRPGETRFQLTYRLPYTGTLTVAPKVTMETDTVAVMMPKSMKFAAGASSPFTPVTEETDTQTYVARNVKPSQPLEFTIGGKGQLPRDTPVPQQQQSQQQPQAASDTSAAQGNNGGGDLTPEEASERQRADTRPGVGLNNPLDSSGELEPWAKYKWGILGLLGLGLAGGAGFMLKTGPAGPSAPAQPKTPATWPPAPLTHAPAAGPGGLLQALKEELFELETDRLSGKLTDAQYAEHKAALEIVLKRALARTGAVATDAPQPETVGLHF